MPLPDDFWIDPPPHPESPPLPETEDQKKQRLLMDALQMNAGRAKLAASMVQPIRERLRGGAPLGPLPAGVEPLFATGCTKQLVGGAKETDDE